MPILVTGGSGFIGSALIQRLSRAGERGVILDLWAPDAMPSGWEFVRADVRAAASVRAAAKGCDGIIHLAAAHHDRGISERTYFGVNEGGTHAVCDAAASQGIRRICFLSTVAVYGDSDLAKDEETVPAPTGPYGASKLAAEAVLRAWAATGAERRALIFRPTAVIGPNNFANLFALCSYLDRPMYVSVGEGRNQKSLAFVDNLVSACLLHWERREGERADVYNYADQPDLSSAEIMTEIRLALGRSPKVLRIPQVLALASALPFEFGGWMLGRDLGISRNRVRKLTQLNSVIRADKIRRSGFIPEVSLRDGLRRTVAWYRAEGRGRTPVKRIPPEQVDDPTSAPRERREL